MMLQPYKRKRPPRMLGAVSAAVICFVILNAMSMSVRNFFYTLSSPLQKVFWGVGESSSNFLSPFFVVHRIKGENSELSLENQKLRADLSRLGELTQENQELRDALEVGLGKDFKMVYAKIISKDDIEDSILVDKGTSDGITKGMPVISQQRVLYGNVAEVYGNYSRINLTSNKGFISDVRIQGKDIFGVIKGSGNLTLYLDLIPQDAVLNAGDVLETSGLKGSFPKNLLIGEIISSKKEDTKPFQEAQVRPVFDIKGIEGLFIITNFKN